MGFWTGVALAGLAAFGIKKIKDEINETNKRKSIACDFDNGISEKEFNEIVIRIGKGIKRISSLYANGTNVYGVVRSQSGISEWKFYIDFNDYGNLTGRYWITSDNDDSDIPKIVAERIAQQVKNASY
jgi:hypothetical protein